VRTGTAAAAAINSFTNTLGPDATVDEVQIAREEVQRTFKVLMEEGGDVVEDQREALNTAAAEFQTAIDEVPNDAALSDSADVLQEQVARVDATRDEYVAELDCG